MSVEAPVVPVSIPCVRVLEFEHKVLAVDWSPDGTRLAVGASEGIVEVMTAEGRSTWRREEPELGSIRRVRWSPSGELIAAILGAARSARAWNAEDGRVRWTSSLESSWNGLAWSPDSRRVALTGGGLLFDGNSGEALPWAFGTANDSIAWSPAGDLLAFYTGQAHHQVMVVASGSASPPRESIALRGHRGTVWDLSWSADSALLASASADHTVRIWQVATGACLWVLEGHQGSVHSVSWLPGESIVASGSGDRTIRLWSAATGREIARLSDHAEEAREVAFSPDGTRLASASADKTVRLWDTSALVSRRPVSGRSRELEAYLARQAATVGRRPARRAPDLWVPEVREYIGTGGRSGAVAISSDSRSAVIGGGDGSLRRVDLGTGASRWRIEQAHRSWVTHVAISRDELLVVSTGPEGVVKVWESASGRQVAEATFQASCRQSALAPDTDLVATAAGDAIALWDRASGRIHGSIGGHLNAVNSVDWHPREALLASGSDDRTVRIWTVAGGRELDRHDHHQSAVTDVCWSPDGDRLASVAFDGSVVVWSLESRRQVSQWKHDGGGYRAVAWSPDGGWVASDAGRSIPISDALNGTEVERFSFDEFHAWRLSWAPNGAFLAASLSGDTIRIFDMRHLVRPHRLIPGSRFRAALASELEPLAGALATLARLSFAAPLSHLRSLLRLLAGGAGDDEPLASFARHPGIAQLAGLRWAAAARVGLLSLLLRSLPREADWAPPAGTSPTELRDALAEALGGEPIAPQAPPLPLAALAQAADALDERLFTLLELVGPEAVAADPGLPLRLLPQVAKLPALRAPQRRLMGLRLRLDQGGPSQGSGLGAERTGIDLRGDLRALLPSQLALPDSVLRARHLRGDLLYRARDGREPPRLKPTVLLLDVSPPTFGPVETVTRLAAHAVASSLLEAGLPVVLITVGGEGSFHPLERREDLVEIWTRRSLEEAQEARALTAARAMAETLREGALEPIVLVLSHAFFGAEAAPSPAPGLRGLFVGYPGGAARPALAEACERWEVLVAGEVESLHDRLGGLVG